MQQAYAWESSLMTWQTDDDLSYRVGQGSTDREVWMLHHEANKDLPKFETIGASSYDFYISGESNVFPEFADPFTVQFVSFTVDGPLSDLALYSILEKAAEDESLNRILSYWDDYRIAFAYPEWYS